MNIIKLNAIDSTNSYLNALSKKVALEDGTIVVAKSQTEGRGQMGSRWQSKEGLSLSFSMFKRFSALCINEQSSINFATSLGIKKALQKLQIPGVTIKWPNDIMSYQKKLCGVLIENKVEGDKIQSSIVGVGLNVNETEFLDLPFAGSMKLASGNTFILDEVLQIVSEAILEELLCVEIAEALGTKKKYEADLFRKNKVSAFENLDGNQFNGIIQGVTDAGELKVEIEDETIQVFGLREIKMLL